MPTNQTHQTLSKPIKTILAIDPSTRGLGVAVFINGELQYYAIKTIKPRRPRRVLLETVAGIIEWLVTEFKPDVLAIERISLVQKSEALLTVVTDDIKTIAADRKLEVKEFEPRFIRRQICQTTDATKGQTAQILCQHFPELAQYLEQQSDSQTRYYAHLFDAVAVGLVCMQEIKESEAKPADQLIF